MQHQPSPIPVARSQQIIAQSRQLGEAGQWDAVLDILRAAIQAEGADGALYAHLVLTLLALNRAAEALETARAGVKDWSDWPALQIALGMACKSNGDLAAAVRAFRAASRAGADPGMCRRFCAQALQEMGRGIEAEALFSLALMHNDKDAAAIAGQADCARLNGKTSAALDGYRKALRYAPTQPVALNGLAMIAAANGQHEEACRYLRELCENHPNHGDAHLNLAQCFQRLGRYREAEAAFARAHSLLHGAMTALAGWLNAARSLADWPLAERLEAELLARLQRHEDLPQCPPFVLAPSQAAPALRAKVAAAHCKALADAVKAPLCVAASMPARVADKRPYRIGYLSADFRGHSVGWTFQSLMTGGDHRRFENYLYDLSPAGGDAVSENIVQNAQHYRRLAGQEAETAAAVIAADQLDLLVDLAGHTRDGGLAIAAHRPAPLQAHYLGYGQTIAADFIDYLITDARTTSPQLAQDCPEALLLLPDSFMAVDPQPIEQQRELRQQAGLPADAFIFCSFNHINKLDRPTFDLWMKILGQVPQSLLWLGSCDDLAWAHLQSYASERGVAEIRLQRAPVLPRAVHLPRLALADLALDSLAHAGGVTTLDALSVGLPVLTRIGSHQANRTGQSLLQAAGLPQLIAKNDADYVEKAVQLARNSEDYAALRAQLQHHHHHRPLFQPAKLMADLQRGYEMMIYRHRAGAQASTINLVAD